MYKAIYKSKGFLDASYIQEFEVMSVLRKSSFQCIPAFTQVHKVTSTQSMEVSAIFMYLIQDIVLNFKKEEKS